MTHATEIVQNYRRALQSLWNDHFWSAQGFRDWETVRDFHRVLPALFRALVGRRLEPLAEPSDELFGPAYRLVPLYSREFSGLQVKPKQEGGTQPQFELLKLSFSKDELRLSVIDFFDWGEHDWRDFRYYRARIHAFDNRPDLVGGEALVDVLTADVIWNPAESLA
jgi:hypothetical protein